MTEHKDDKEKAKFNEVAKSKPVQTIIEDLRKLEQEEQKEQEAQLQRPADQKKEENQGR
jgi:hypothetical protein